ncbi:MAG: SigE family RNA polymerase sigma factor [Nocardioides sp.]
MRHGAEEEFTAFVHAQSASLFRTAYLLTGDHRRAEDLLRRTLVKVCLHWPRVSAMEQPRGFARRVLVHEVVSLWHRRPSEGPPMVLREGDSASRVVWDAVLTLPPRQRAVLVLRHYEGLTGAETADVLGIAVGSVESHAHAAGLRLADLLAGRGSAPRTEGAA